MLKIQNPLSKILTSTHCIEQISNPHHKNGNNDQIQKEFTRILFFSDLRLLSFS